MKHNPIQFAVVREDPEVEAALIRLGNVKKVLLIASGGCTALTLKTLFPNISFVLIDINLAQIELIKNKIIQLKDKTSPAFFDRFNICSDNLLGLNQCGNFESLFRCFRLFINEFILEEEELKEIFEDHYLKSNHKIEILIKHNYWPTAFDLFFSDSLLVTMFGKDAIQHATVGSYPRYFQNMIEKGLLNPNRSNNYFLHHIFLGKYLNKKDALPIYLRHKVDSFNFDFINSSILEINDINTFDLISLSNIFDWMPCLEIANYFKKLKSAMKPGSFLLYRQLNNTKNYSQFYLNAFELDISLGENLLLQDRSLFYEKINVLQKKRVHYEHIDF